MSNRKFPILANGKFPQVPYYIIKEKLVGILVFIYAEAE